MTPHLIPLPLGDFFGLGAGRNRKVSFRVFELALSILHGVRDILDFLLQVKDRCLICDACRFKYLIPKLLIKGEVSLTFIPSEKLKSLVVIKNLFYFIHQFPSDPLVLKIRMNNQSADITSRFLCVSSDRPYDFPIRPGL